MDRDQPHVLWQEGDELRRCLIDPSDPDDGRTVMISRMKHNMIRYRMRDAGGREYPDDDDEKWASLGFYYGSNHLGEGWRFSYSNETTVFLALTKEFTRLSGVICPEHTFVIPAGEQSPTTANLFDHPAVKPWVEARLNNLSSVINGHDRWRANLHARFREIAALPQLFIA